MARDPAKARFESIGPEGARLIAFLQQREEAERAGLARTLHHDVSGMLAAARMDLSRISAHLGVEADVREQLARVDQLLDQVIADARRQMQRLHPALLDHFGLPVALRHLVEDGARATGLQYEFDLVEEYTGVDPQLSMAVYRLVESLLAPGPVAGSQINLGIDRQREAYTLRIELRPPPGDPAEASWIGLPESEAMIATRVWIEALGGNWRESHASSRRSIELRLPRRTESFNESELQSETPGG